MAVFFLTQILDAAIARLKANPVLSFAPKVIQRGDLSWYAENFPELPLELPAVLVWAPDGISIGVEGNDPEGYTVGSGEVGTWGRVRVAVVDVWTPTPPVDLYARRIAYVQEIAGKLLGATGTGYDLGAAIPGFTVLRAIPTKIQPVAAEDDDLVSQDSTRKLWAGAVDFYFSGRAER